MQRKSVLLAVASVLAVVQNEAEAHAKYALVIPNGGSVPGTSAVGHNDPNGGGSLNQFGVAFLMALHSWTQELCQADSDGDGQTNGQELGDPCCEWTSASGRFPRWSAGISHPGDATKTSNASRWAHLHCSGSTSAVERQIFVAVHVFVAEGEESGFSAILEVSATVQGPSGSRLRSLMPRSPRTLGALCAACVALSRTAEAYSSYPVYIPNANNVPGTYAIGHVDHNGGGTLNAFGQAFADAGYKWTKELCEADSDGDGQTNGQELGDPCCEWDMEVDGKPRWRRVSHPGDASKTSDEARWKDIVCERRPTDV